MVSGLGGRVRRLTALAAAGTVAVATLLTVSSSPAYAHSRSSAVYYGCGSGYVVVSDGVRTIRRYSDNKVVGEVVLTYNSSTGRNCVVTYKKTGAPWHGVRSYMTAKIRVEDQDWDTEGGFFYHWESITKYARGKCVMYSGSITSPDGSDAGSAGRFEWGNCG